MANLQETSVWEAGIYQLETSDPVMGGENGIDNKAPRQLANRTLWLKEQIQNLDTSKVSFKGLLNQTDLNTLNANTGLGVWQQNLDANTSAQRNYPVNQAGVLLVMPSAYMGLQLYLPYTSNVIYKRNTTNNAGAWGEWVAIGEVINDFNSNSTTSALSAAKGKELKTEKLDKTANAVSATKLQTARRINGVAFDGTADIIIPDNTKAPLNHRHNFNEINNVPNASDTLAGIVSLSHNTNGTDKTKAASEFALGEVRRLANQAQVSVNGISLTWNNIANKPSTFPPATHTHTTADITGLSPALGSKLNKAGDTLTGALSIASNASAPAASTSSALSYGRFQCWGAIQINANTDNSNNDEPVLITSGKGLSNNKAQGLAIGSDYLTWLGNDVATINDNVATATKLQTPRTINGVAFDGTADITVTDGTKAALNHSHSWNEIVNKPATFTPSSHRHNFNEINNVPNASDTLAGIVSLSHNTNGADKTKAASEFALGEVRRLANQAQVSVNGISLTWNNIANKPATFTPSSHRHNWGEINNTPTSVQAYGITNAMRTDADNTTTGLIKINRLASYIQGIKNNTQNSWYVGSGSSANDNVQLYSWILDTKLELLNNKVQTNKALYVNDNEVYHAGNLPSVTWDSITNKPITFTPTAHRHNFSQIDNVPTASSRTAGIVQLNNTLTSDSTTQALTAAQGKVLKEAVDAKVSTEVKRGVNANTLHTDGVYAMPSGGENLPTSDAYKLMVIGGSETYWTHQMAFQAYSNEVYIRSLTGANSGTWTAWQRIDGSDKVGKTSNETISGVKTFSSSPLAPTPDTNSNDTTLATTQWVRQHASGSSNLAQNGYIKLPSGLILQWGKTNQVRHNKINFPIRFPNQAFSVVITTKTGTADNDGMTTHGVSSISEDGFWLFTWVVPNDGYYWQAIGY